MRLLVLPLLTALAGSAAPAQPVAGPPALGFPLACQIGRDCEVQQYLDRDPGPGAQDYRCGPRSYQDHNGVDIRLVDMARQRAGVAVLAAAAGKVSRLRDGVPDISIRAAGAPSVKGAQCGNGVVIDHGGGWETQYCHLAKGSVRVRQGQVVAAGAPIARVGLSGDTEFAHLHLTVRHQTRVVDPFAPRAGPGCAPQAPLWTPQAMRAMTYKRGAVLNAGFAPGPVSQDQVEAGDLPAFDAASAAIVAYVRAIGLEAGDVLDLTLLGPDGAVLAQQRLAPLPRHQAQYLTFVGKRRPPGGWPRGAYVGRYQVIREGQPAVTRTFRVTL